MWSVENLNQESEVSSEGEKLKVRINMIRVRAAPLDNEELEEEGYKIGCQGNDSMAKVVEDIEAMHHKQRLLNEDYDEVQ